MYEKICNAESFAQTASESVDCIVYLDVEPVDCRYRVQNMRKTESEQEIPLSYFQGIDDMYFDMMLKVLQDPEAPKVIELLVASTESHFKVLVMRWSEFGTTEELISLLDQTLTGATA